MHDPMTVAFTIYRPWPKRANLSRKRWYWPPVVTIWHVDPETDGSDDSCRWFKQGRPWYRHPRWHVWHWKIQIHPLQAFKRWAFTRCSGCGKRFKWGYAPTAKSWGGSGPMWFKSERGLFHTYGECDGLDTPMTTAQEAKRRRFSA